MMVEIWPKCKLLCLRQTQKICNTCIATFIKCQRPRNYLSCCYCCSCWIFRLAKMPYHLIPPCYPFSSLSLSLSLSLTSPSFPPSLTLFTYPSITLLIDTLSLQTQKPLSVLFIKSPMLQLIMRWPCAAWRWLPHPLCSNLCKLHSVWGKRVQIETSSPEVRTTLAVSNCRRTMSCRTRRASNRTTRPRPSPAEMSWRLNWRRRRRCRWRWLFRPLWSSSWTRPWSSSIRRSTGCHGFGSSRQSIPASVFCWPGSWRVTTFGTCRPIA